MGGVPGVAVAEVVLDEAQVVTLVRQGEPTGMAKHVRVDSNESGPRGNGRDQIVDRLPREG
jgi:hypothetical protein